MTIRRLARNGDEQRSGRDSARIDDDIREQKLRRNVSAHDARRAGQHIVQSNHGCACSNAAGSEGAMPYSWNRRCKTSATAGPATVSPHGESLGQSILTSTVNCGFSTGPKPTIDAMVASGM